MSNCDFLWVKTINYGLQCCTAIGFLLTGTYCDKIVRKMVITVMNCKVVVN